MKKLLLFLALLLSSLRADSMFTLDHINNLSVYIDSRTPFMGSEERDEVKSLILSTLGANGFVFNQRDPVDLIVEITAKEVEDEMAISINFILSQEVMARRGEQRVMTFANVYQQNQLIISDDPMGDTLSTVEVMMLEFLKSHAADNDE
ncbi:MAG: hypothetical protein WCR69_03910 [Sulfuricurvum sp.]